MLSAVAQTDSLISMSVRTSLHDQISGLHKSLGNLEQMLALAIEVEQQESRENMDELEFLRQRVSQLEALVAKSESASGSVHSRLATIEATLERIASGLGVATPAPPPDPAPHATNVVESLERLQSSLRQLQSFAQPAPAPRSARRA